MNELKIKIIDLMNESQLPFEAKFYVIKDVYRDINELYQDMLIKKQQEQEETTTTTEVEQEESKTEE